jgi:hypothetical protein
MPREEHKHTLVTYTQSFREIYGSTGRFDISTKQKTQEEIRGHRNDYINNYLPTFVAQEPKASLPYSQQPATGPCPEPVESNPHSPKPISLISVLAPSSHLRLGLPSGLFPSGFPIKTLYFYLLSQYVPHVPPTSFALISLA